MKKLRQKIAGFLNNSHHARTIGLVGLLTIIIAIPLTVYILQQQQDVRQRAIEPTGFKAIKAAGCGEIISQPAVGATEGDFVFQAPIRAQKGWETHKTDGEIIATGDMYKKMWEQFNTKMNLSRTIEEFTISCTLIIQYGGDCRAEVQGPGTSKDNMLSQGQTTTIHLKYPVLVLLLDNHHHIEL